MKVLLKEDVESLGLAGEVYDVANGYGRNYLIPKGYAVKASPGVMNQAENWRIATQHCVIAISIDSLLHPSSSLSHS